jgi:membrane dipeptidase
MNDVSSTRVERVHRDSIIIDGHCDTLGDVIGKERRLGERSALGQFDLPRALDGGLTAQLTATYFDTDWPGTAIHQTLQTIDAYYEELETYADLAMPAVCADDVLQAKELGKVALILSMEGAEGLAGDLSVLRIYYRLGLRVLGITWNRRNEAADGVGEIRTGGGLTHFGVELVQECNRLGIIIDIAHLARAGVQDVLELSELPVVATHANAYAVWPHPRNLTDAQLESIASKGGVVGVNALPHHLGSEDEMHGPLSLILDHIDHMVSVMGEDGVGIGMDFDGMGERRTEGMEDVSKLPNLTKGLVERGYTDEAINKILGDNFLRVFREVL